MCLEQKIRVLIVDDDPSIVSSLGHLANSLQFEALETIDPQNALVLASQQQVDVAVIDLHMPEMDGIELMRLLRRINGEIQVILITGDPSAGAVSKAIQAGACDYLRKPLRSRDLSDSLTALRQRVLRRSAAVESEPQCVGAGCGAGGKGSWKR